MPEAIRHSVKDKNWTQTFSKDASGDLETGSKTRLAFSIHHWTESLKWKSTRIHHQLMKNLQSALTIKYSDFKGPSKCHFHEEYSLNVLSVVFTRSNSALIISQQSKCVHHCGAATVMPSTLEEEPKSTTRPLGSKNVLDSRNEEEEETSSSEIQDMKQLEGMLSVRTPRMVMFTFCLYSCLSSDIDFGFGYGVLRNSFEKQKRETYEWEK